MTEIKPVYQIFFDECTRWVDANEVDFELYDLEDTRILYPAAAYESLQKELAAQAKRISELEILLRNQSRQLENEKTRHRSYRDQRV